MTSSYPRGFAVLWMLNQLQSITYCRSGKLWTVSAIYRPVTRKDRPGRGHSEGNRFILDTHLWVRVRPASVSVVVGLLDLRIRVIKPQCGSFAAVNRWLTPGERIDEPLTWLRSLRYVAALATHSDTAAAAEAAIFKRRRQNVFHHS